MGNTLNPGGGKPPLGGLQDLEEWWRGLSGSVIHQGIVCTDGSVATCRASHARLVGGKKPDEEAYHRAFSIAGVWA